MYYIIYGFLYLISLLPFFILYGISDFACFMLYRVIRYRKRIILKNILIAFPAKSEQEREKITGHFYKNLVDTFIETIKMQSLSEKEFNKRAIINLDDCNAMAKKGLNIQFQSGHQMNWEYVNWAISRKLEIPFVGVYMKITNKALDRIFFNMRQKFGTVLVAATEFRKRMHKVFDKQYSIALAADQNPGNPDNTYWLNFFNVPTAFVTGPDKGARRNNTAVVFVKFIKIKRGYYKFEPIIITENAVSLAEGELTRLYRDFLEETIREHPDNYLWSHQRWKWEYKDAYAKKWIDDVPAPGKPGAST